MRVAFIGKGGAGKSTIVGTFARLLARTGDRVVILDSDPMPSLAISLGIEPTDRPIPDDAVEDLGEDERPRYRLRSTASDAVEQYAFPCADGVKLLQLGKLRGHASRIPQSHAAFRHIAVELPEDWGHVIGDLPGGTRQPFMGWASFATQLVAVIEPTAKSILTGRRLLRLRDLSHQPAVAAVANKVKDPDDRAMIEERTGLPVIGAVPLDPAVVDADRTGRALLDMAPDAPAVDALRSLVDAMRTGVPG